MTDKRALIVDAPGADRDGLAGQLQSAGYAVLTADDGEHGLHVVLADAPPVVIMGWTSPVVGGREFCAALRTHEGVGIVYIIVLDDGRRRESMVEAFDAGADDYLVRPYEPVELLARIRAGERVVGLEADLAKRHRELFAYHARLTLTNEKLERAVTVDPLTGLNNRAAGTARARECWAIAARYGDPFALIVLDIDHFKRINDEHGHAAGDAVLRETGRALQRAARFGETVCRYGGEEFLIVCPRSTARMAAHGAERIRQAIAQRTTMVGGKALSVTVSCGVAERAPLMDGVDDLLAAADAAMYAAKRGGRNRVVVSGIGDGIQPVASVAALGGGPGRELSTRDEGESAGTILLADPDARSRGIAATVLAGRGLNVASFCEIEGAMAAFQSHLPDVIVLSSAFPRDRLADALREIKRNPASWELPVLMLHDGEDGDPYGVVTDGLIDGCLAHAAVEMELGRRVGDLLRLRTARMEVVRAHDLLGEQARAMTLMLELAQDLSTAVGLDVVLERVVAAAAEMTCCRTVTVLLPDASRETLHVVKTVGIDELSAADVLIRRGQGAVGRAFERAQSTLAGDAGEAAEYADGPDALLLGRGPFLCKPLMSANDAVGVLTVADRQGQSAFGPRELEYVDLLSNIIAPAIVEIAARQARDEARDSIVVALATLAEQRDSSTGQHLDRVTQFALLLARELRAAEPHRSVIDDRFMGDLVRAVPLHDIGKVGVPDQILLKPGKLTPAERSVMQTHTQVGADTIRAIAERVPGVTFLNMAADITHAHHEWFDGTGYPRGLKGTDIPLEARIAAVADVYDALTTKRCYKAAYSHERARRIIGDGAGTHFDPDVVAAFVRREHDFISLAESLADDDQTVGRATRETPAVRPVANSPSA